MKPFLLLATRPEDAAADNEYELFLRFSGLDERDLRRIRLEQRALGRIDLRDWSGLLLGGGPFNSSDPETSKSPVQRRVEADLRGLLDQVISEDFPFLGACYGIGALGTHQGAVVDRRYSEPVGAVSVTLTREGQQDPLLGGLPATFEAFTGHKEAISHLRGTPSCWPRRPAARCRRSGSARRSTPPSSIPSWTAGLCTRIEVYKHAGYFPPEQADEIKARADRSNVVHPHALLRRFVGSLRPGRCGRAAPRGAPVRGRQLPGLCASGSSPAGASMMGTGSRPILSAIRVSNSSWAARWPCTCATSCRVALASWNVASARLSAAAACTFWPTMMTDSRTSCRKVCATQVTSRARRSGSRPAG